MADLAFPKGFLWGASTSAYQTEGCNGHADWVGWETQGGSAEPCGIACDSWHRFRDDVDVAARLGLGIYRISIEWSRVEPEEGRFDDGALAHYRAWLTYARSKGLATMVVLWHFTNPQWFVDGGGWQQRAAAETFGRYAQRVAVEVGGLVDWWATLNEVNTYARHGWITGEWPPGRKADYAGGLRVYGGLARAHRRARQAIKRVVGDHARVGLTHVVPWAHRATGAGPLGHLAVAWWKWLALHHFLDRVRADLDWLGVQYYHDAPLRITGYDLDDGAAPRTDIGWRICPEGLYHAVRDMTQRYGVPIIVTENGLADAADRQRARFIIDHLAWLHRAIAEGCDVRGYLHWSLIDNFEWALGFAPRFGLASVDYETQAREIRPSAHVYARIAEANAIPSGLGAEARYADGSGSLAP